MTSKFKKNKSGQGLLEAIISIGIIVSGVVGVMNLTLTNQAAVEETSVRLAAVNLAREGIEVIRNQRDSNWLNRQIWDTNLEDGTDYTAIPVFDKDTNIWSFDFDIDDISEDEALVYIEDGVYFQSGAEPVGADLTNYRRLIALDEICEDKTLATSGSSCLSGNPKIGIKVTSRVDWSFKGRANSLVLEERIFNWR